MSLILPWTKGIIDDSTEIILPDHEEGRGAVARDYSANPWGTLGYASPNPLTPIPESEWKDRIDFKKRTKTRLIDMIQRVGWQPHNQARTLLCWANCVVMAAELLQIIMHGGWVTLSAASIALPIVGGNRGGFPGDAVKYGKEHGFASDANWSTNDVSWHKTDAVAADRQLYRFGDWIDLRPRSQVDAATCLLQDQPLPVCSTFNWMSHAVTLIDIDYDDQGWIWTYANSGLYRDANGYTQFRGKRSVADDQLAPFWVLGL